MCICSAYHQFWYSFVLGFEKYCLFRMNLWQVANFLKDQNVMNAVNLDGGGSATYVLNGSLASYPSDHWCVNARAKIHINRLQYAELTHNISVLISATLQSGAARGPYPLCCVFTRGCASQRTAAGMGDVWRASVCVRTAGAGLAVPILHARLNVESTGSALRVSRTVYWTNIKLWDIMITICL